jgi:hypothetical protein
MSHEFPESDWKVLSRLRPIALDRFCERVIAQINELGSDSKSAHERYLAIYRLVKKRDEELAYCFNDLRRSNALLRLLAVRSFDLLTDEEFAEFSEQTRSSINSLIP